MHFGGPAFLAWTRMGNIHSYMGPLPQRFVCDQGGEAHRYMPNDWVNQHCRRVMTCRQLYLIQAAAVPVQPQARAKLHND